MATTTVVNTGVEASPETSPVAEVEKKGGSAKPNFTKGAVEAQSPTDVQMSNNGRLVQQYLNAHFERMTKTKVFTEAILRSAAYDLCQATEIICNTGDRDALQVFLDYVKKNIKDIMSSNNSQRGNIYVTDRPLADRMSMLCELAYRAATNDKSPLNVEVVRKFLNVRGKSEDIILFFAPNG